MSNIIHRTADDSYVIEKNGLPYHVPNEGEFAGEWAEVSAYALEHPEEVTEEAPYVPSEEEIAAAAKAEQEAANAAAKELILNKLIAETAQSMDFTTEEYNTLALADNIFPEWAVGETYSEGTRLLFTSAIAATLDTRSTRSIETRTLYQVAQETTASADNLPHSDTETYIPLSGIETAEPETDAESTESAESEESNGETVQTDETPTDDAAELTAAELKAQIEELTKRLSTLDA